MIDIDPLPSPVAAPASGPSPEATAAFASALDDATQSGDDSVADDTVADADADREAAVEGCGGECADAGKRHLAERQLSGPAGDDGERDCADGEGDDAGVEEVS